MNKPRLRRLLPSLAGLEAFEAVARLKNVTEAARELGRTQSAVSRQLAKLETFAKRSLFMRDRNRLALTEAGTAFSAVIGRLLNQLEADTARLIAGGIGDRLLTLGVLPTFGSRWLLPKLGGFQAAELGIDLKIISAIEQFDLQKPGIDVAIQYGRGDWPDLVSYELEREEIVAVASPALIESVKSPQIEDFDWLHMMTRPDAWGIWTRSRSGRDLHKHGMKFENFTMLIESACLGLGVAVLPTIYIRNELASGRLITAFGNPVATGLSYWLVHSVRLAETSKVIAFREWLLSKK